MALLELPKLPEKRHIAQTEVVDQENAKNSNVRKKSAKCGVDNLPEKQVL